MGAPSLPHFLLNQTFFGFNAQDRVALHENIFNMIWYSDGRLDWDTIYNMPVFLRKFYSKKINKIFREQEENMERIKNQQKTRSQNKKQTVMPPMFPKSSS
jgi:hypothetical protein